MRIDIKGSIIPNDYAWIYEYLELDGTCPKQVTELIDKADGEPIDVYIDSSGGDIFAGSAIYSALRSYKGIMNIHVVGLAASAASVIACAGQSDISPTAMIMVHNVSTSTSGDYHDMDKSSETLKKANKAIAAAYTKKTGMSEAEALAMMDAETWLPAKEAVERGLIDKIAEKESMQLTASISSILSAEVVSKLKNIINHPNETNNAVVTAKAKLQLLKLKGGI